MISDLLPKDSPPDIRAMHRAAAARVSAAVRHGHVRDALRWNRVLKRALRALRFAARIRAGRVRTWVFDDTRCIAHPHSSHPLFSEAAEKGCDPTPPEQDRRRTFREDRLRC